MIPDLVTQTKKWNDCEIFTVLYGWSVIVTQLPEHKEGP